jgi:uncharacterized protein YegP (UPF0339 family)
MSCAVDSYVYWPWYSASNGEFILADSGNAYDMEENLRKLIELLKTNGYVLNGEVEWVGEEMPDLGKIVGHK